MPTRTQPGTGNCKLNIEANNPVFSQRILLRHLLLLIMIVFMVIELKRMAVKAQEFEADHNFCDPNPCHFDGICQSLAQGYVCSCVAGTTGYNCEMNLDDCAFSNSSNSGGEVPKTTKCQLVDANATCVDLLDDYRCICSDHFFGDQCDIPVEDRALTDLFPAHNHSDLIQLIEMLVQDSELFPELMPFFVKDTEKRTEMSWTLEDLFVWASFAGRQLELDEEIVPWNDPLMGNCFSFGQSGKIYDVADIGANYGFQALLRVAEEEYLPWTKAAAVNVFVQQRNEHIFPNSPHFSVAPGTEAQMLMTQRGVGRLDDIYGNCINRSSETKTFFYPGIYTVVGCLQSCYQNQVHLVCGCTDPRYLGIANIPVCGLDKALCVLNVTKVYGDSSSWDSCGTCYEPCEENILDVLWYSTDFANSSPQCRNSSAGANCQEQALFSVFFKFNVLEDYDQNPSQTFNQWLFQFGGITGIIAGFSFISIIEIIFFLYRTFLTYCTNEAVTQDLKDLQFVDEEDADFDVFIEPIRATTTIQ